MDSLPREIRSVVISFVSDAGLRNLRLANKQWFEQIRYNDFTFNFTTEEQIPQIVRRLKQYSFPIGVTFNRSKCALRTPHYELLAQLTHLTKLNLHDMMVEDDDMSPLTRLTNLEEAKQIHASVLEHCPNLKKIESGFMASQLDLSKFSQLESIRLDSPSIIDSFLTLSNTRVTDLQLFAEHSKEPVNHLDLATRIAHAGLAERYPQLKILSFMENIENDKICFDFPFLPCLESLELSSPKIGCLAALHNTLTSLTLYGDSVSCSSLAALTKLRALTVFFRSTLTATDLEFLTALTNLEKYASSYNSDLGNWAELAKYIRTDKLTSLTLYGQQKFEDVAKLSKLQALSFGNPLDPRPVAGNFPHLTKLQLRNGSPKDFAFVESLTTLKKLNFKCNDSHNSILKIEQLRDLEHLNITGADNSIFDLGSITHLKLKSLTISWHADQFAEHVRQIPTLEKISLLDASQLTDQSIALLAGLTNLTALTLHNVGSMTGETLTLLTSLQMLEMRCTKRLKLYGNSVLNKMMPRLFYIDIMTSTNELPHGISSHQ